MAASQTTSRLLILFSASFYGLLKIPTDFKQCEIIAYREAEVCLAAGSTYCGVPVFDWSDWSLTAGQAAFHNHRLTLHNVARSPPLKQTLLPGDASKHCLHKQASAPRLADLAKNVLRGSAAASNDLLALFSMLNIPMATAASSTMALLVSSIKLSDRGIFVNAQFRKSTAFAGSFKASTAEGAFATTADVCSVAVGSATYFIPWETLVEWFQQAWDILLEFLRVVWFEIKSRIVWFFETLIKMAQKLAGQTAQFADQVVSVSSQKHCA